MLHLRSNSILRRRHQNPARWFLQTTAALLLIGSSASAEKFQKVMQVGDPMPGTGLTFLGVFNDRSSIGPGGHVSFVANIFEPSTPSNDDNAYWSGRVGEPPVMLARRKNPIPPPGGGSLIYENMSPTAQFDAQGNAYFRALISSNGTVNLNNFGLFRVGPGGSSTLVHSLRTFPAPGFPGAHFSNLYHLSANKSGTTLLAGTAIHPTSGTKAGIWYGAGGSLQLAVLSSSPLSPPPSPAFSGEYGFIDSSVRALINDRGQILFKADFDPDVGSVFRAIWLGQPGALDWVVRRSDPVPGMSVPSTFNDFARPSLNNAGKIAFIASTFTATFQNGTGLWVGSKSNLVLIAEQTVTAAPVGVGGVMLNSIGQPTLADDGSVGFHSWLIGAGVTLANDTSIWKHRGDALQLIAREGGTAPGFPEMGDPRFGALNEDVSEIVMSASGQIAFWASVNNQASPFETVQAVFATNPSGQLEVVAKTGETITVGAETGVIQSVSLYVGTDDYYQRNGSDGRPTSFNHRGQVCLGLRFSSGLDDGIFVVNLGPPSITSSPVTTSGADQVILSFLSRSDRTYDVFSTPALTSVWNAVSTHLAGNGGEVTVSNVVSTSTGFLRAVQQ